LEAGRVDQSERMAHQKLIDAGVLLESKFEQYTRTNVAEMRPYVPGETLAANISISSEDKLKGSPKIGDMIARNPKNHEDQWLVAAEYFKDNFSKKGETIASTEQTQELSDKLEQLRNQKHYYEVTYMGNVMETFLCEDDAIEFMKKFGGVYQIHPVNFFRQ